MSLQLVIFSISAQYTHARICHNRIKFNMTGICGEFFLWIKRKEKEKCSEEENAKEKKKKNFSLFVHSHTLCHSSLSTTEKISMKENITMNVNISCGEVHTRIHSIITMFLSPHLPNSNRPVSVRNKPERFGTIRIMLLFHKFLCFE